MSDSNEALSLYHSATGTIIPQRIGVQFTLLLTGSNEVPAVADIAIPISSINTSFYLNTTSFMSIVVPATLALVSDIEARENGDLILTQHSVYQNGSTAIERIYSLPLKEFSYDAGARSASMTLTGRGTLPKNVAPKSITLPKVIAKNRVNDPVVKFDFTIQPIDLVSARIGDIVGDGVNAGTMERLSYSISPKNPRISMRVAA